MKKRNLLNIALVVFIIYLTSCNSTPKSNDGLINYSTIQYSKMTIYNLGIDIHNRKLSSLKQNIISTININNGAILNDSVENINTNRIAVTIPKENISGFMEKIKTFGTVVNETLHSNEINNDDFESQSDRVKKLLEKYETLLKSANNITDKIAVEKEISTLQYELESMRRRSVEMENRIENIMVSITLFRGPR